MITRERLKQAIHYDPESGAFTRLGASGAEYPMFKKGVPESGGKINIDGKHYSAHRMAYLYVLGWIPSYVFPRFGDKTDNRWESIAHADNKSGLSGVVFERDKFGCVGRWLSFGGLCDSKVDAYETSWITNILNHKRWWSGVSVPEVSFDKDTSVAGYSSYMRNLSSNIAT